MLAFISIPRSTLPPSPPLRLLCAEAAFHHLVLQGGKRARKEGLTDQQTERRRKKENEREKEDRGRESEHTESEREKKKSVLEPDIDFSDRVFPVTKAGNSAKVKSLGYESLVNFKKHRI